MLLCMNVLHLLPVLLRALCSVPISCGYMMGATGGLGMLPFLPGMSA